MVRDSRDNCNKWTDAKITEKKGPLSYKVQTGEKGHWCRHADQMITNSGVQPEKAERCYPLRERKLPE